MADSQVGQLKRQFNAMDVARKRAFIEALKKKDSNNELNSTYKVFLKECIDKYYEDTGENLSNNSNRQYRENYNYSNSGVYTNKVANRLLGIGTVIFMIGIIISILTIIGSIVMIGSEQITFGVMGLFVGMLISFASFIGRTLYQGFAEIIELLDGIKDKRWFKKGDSNIWLKIKTTILMTLIIYLEM